MTTWQRISLIGLALATFLTLLLLSAALENTTLETRNVISLADVTATRGPRGEQVFTERTPATFEESPWWPLIVFVTILLILLLFDERARAAAIAAVILIGLFYIGVLIARWFSRPRESEDVQLPPFRLDEFLSNAIDAVPPIPDWLVLVISLLIVGGLGVLSTWLYKRFTTPAEPDIRQKLARDLQFSIAEINAGKDYRDTITACYETLLKTLSQERNITRNQALTPQEFAAQLATLGLPTAQITTLTRLFETARYGTGTPDPAQLKAAQDCLQSIQDWLKTSPSTQP